MQTKTKRHIFILAIALGLAITTSSAQEGADPYKKAGAKAAAPATAVVETDLGQMVQTTIEWIEVKTADATTLLRGGLAANSAELIQQIRDLEKNNLATVVEATSITTKSGQRAQSEGVKEYRYPTDHDAAETPKLKQLDLSGNQLKDQRIVISAEAHATMQPKTFEMRALGGRIEVEALIGPDGRTLDLNLSPELSRIAGTTAHGTVRLGGENLISNSSMNLSANGKMLPSTK